MTEGQESMKGGALVLMGLRGSGKSTVGRAVALQCGAAFVDLDDRTRLEMGAETVAQAFREQGEPAFRAAEVRALRAVIGEANRHGSALVLALGGGTPTAQGAEALLRTWQRDGAVLVYLRTDADVLAGRLGAALGDRPSLTGKGAIEEISDVLAQRDARYEALADAAIDAAGSVEETARRVMDAWRAGASG